MVAGNVDHETGTRDLHVLGGLRRVMPWTALAGILAALSKAGAPPMFGFIGKEMLYKTKLDIETIGAWAISASVVANVALVASALMVSVGPFLGRRGDTPKPPHEAPPAMLVGAVLLSLMGLGRGLMPHPFESGLGSATATAILGRPVEMHLKLWHGVDPAALTVLALSMLTLAAGWGVYRLVRARVAPLGPVLRHLVAWGPTQAYDLALEGLYAGADRVTRLIQSGRLRYYVMTTLGFAVFVAGPPLLRALRAAPETGTGGWRVHEVVAGGLILVAALAATLVKSRLTALVLVGVVGTGMALLFVFFSAPDLALTQLMIEVLSVVLLVMVLYRLPRVVRRSGMVSRLRDLVLAVAVGAMMTGFVLTAARVARDDDVSAYHLAQSVPAAHGRNVVNVILVDFRALDTLGEITVLAAAGLGVIALMRGRRGKEQP
jgi:multicomponent Na+:H+ antiporter subunit A